MPNIKTRAGRAATAGSAVLIDTAAGEICFFRAGDAGEILTESESLAATPFSEEFYERLSHVLDFRQTTARPPLGKRTGRGEESTVLLLPDELFVTDSLAIPLVKRSLVNSSLLLAINELYRNSEEMKIGRAHV